MLALLLSVSISWAGCEEPTNVSTFNAVVSGAQSAFSAMDLEAFTAARKQANRALNCLDEPMDAVAAARYHRLMALDAYLAKDTDSVVSAFQSALIAQPAYSLPSSLAPEGNPLQQLYVQAGEAQPSGGQELAVPAGMILHVDGHPGTERPLGRPTILQLMTNEGAVVSTRWLDTESPDPDWAVMSALTPAPAAATPAAAVPAAQAEAVRPPREPVQLPPVALLSATSVAAIAAIVTYGAASASVIRYMDEGEIGTVAELEQLRTTTNNLVKASGVAGGVAVGLGASMFLTARW
ncbi:MAG: hypothetical protein QGG40_01575 [Myxococcota bacterium]|jgi:hypothetical protein|nr:hypothetical protein [Myxococcota bacterium]